jgi:hypothetical protein
MPVRWPKVGLEGTVVGQETHALRVEDDAAFVRMSEAYRLRTEAQTGGNRARQSDSEAYMAAMRSGGKDPGPANVQRLALQEQDAARRIAGENVTRAAIERDVQAMRQERQDAWLADLDAQRGDALETVRETWRLLQAGTADVVRLDAIRRWVITGRPEMAVSPVLTALDALGAALAAWEPPQEERALYLTSEGDDA